MENFPNFFTAFCPFYKILGKCNIYDKLVTGIRVVQFSL